MRAAIVTVGSELVEGLRVDTNTAEIARALAPRGLRVFETVSVGDDVEELASVLARLTASCTLVVVTGGLGPTHDDITREAASRALEVPLVRDQGLEEWLAPIVARHRDPEAAAQVLVQADLLQGAEVFGATTGTAPGQLVATPAGSLALLPGPPAEMRPMLRDLVERYPLLRAEPHELGVVGLSESDAQVIAQRSLAEAPGVGLTVLARPGDVRVILLDEGAGPEALADAAVDVADSLGAHCYSVDGSTLAEAVVREAAARGVTVAAAESCTGGLVSAAVTDVAGSSVVLRGGVVAYHNDAKRDLLGVDPEALELHGAVSEAVARQMAEGARDRLGADIAVGITGIAGPEGGTPDKPVGLVWFAVASGSDCTAERRAFPPTSRDAVRQRATSTALDLLRHEVLKVDR